MKRFLVICMAIAVVVLVASAIAPERQESYEEELAEAPSSLPVSLVKELSVTVDRALVIHEERLLLLKQKEIALRGMDEKYHWALSVYIQDIRHQMGLAANELLILELLVESIENNEKAIGPDYLEATTAAVALKRFQLISEAVDERLETLSAVIDSYKQTGQEKSSSPTA